MLLKKVRKLTQNNITKNKLNINIAAYNQKSTFFSANKKEKKIDYMFSEFDNTKFIPKTETNFFKRMKESKKKNTFLIGGLNNIDSPKSSGGFKNFNYEKSLEKNKKNSDLKNIDKLKRMKNLFEKKPKFVEDNSITNKRTNLLGLQGLQGLKNSLTKKISQTGTTEGDYFKKFDKRIFEENNEKNENNMNSDLLRLELMNLNCYTNKDIKSIKGSDSRFSNLNNFSKDRRTKSTTFSILDGLSEI